MNRFNRDFALVGINGRILIESHTRERLAQFQTQLAEEGIHAEIVASDLPRSRGQ